MLAIVSHADCLLHDAGPHHPERAERLRAIDNQITTSGLDAVVRHYDAPKASREQLIRAHDGAYVDRIFRLSPNRGSVMIDGDTVMSPGSLDAALRAAGAGILGVDLIMREEANPVFCNVRPPGHHAERAEAMGFCLFNNIAVAASHAFADYGLERVAIVDFDVHHGNGTEDIVKSDNRVLFCSSFQHPFYPYSGYPSDAENYVAVPLSAGTNGPAFRSAITKHWLPALDAFRPQLLLVSAGFDAHFLDDMSNIGLAEADYTWVTQQIKTIADRHASGRILSMLEGGYETGSLARSVVAHLKVLRV